jgi:hypothetical protein
MMEGRRFGAGHVLNDQLTEVPMSVATQVEAEHYVNILPPIDITGGVTGDRFHMRHHKKAKIVVQVGVSAAAFTKIILRSCDAATSGTATDIAFSMYAEETAAGDTLSSRTAVAATGHTPDAANNIFYVIELDASELVDGDEWVELALTNTTNAVLASAVAILSGSRFGGDQSGTVIA